MITITNNIQGLNADLALYMQLSGMSDREVLEKQGGKLGYLVRRNLMGIRPAKGSIRSQAFELLRSGQGIHVRKRVREAIQAKYNSSFGFGMGGVSYGAIKLPPNFKQLAKLRYRGAILQALMVDREINTRESGRGFLSASSRYPRTLRTNSTSFSRYGHVLGQVGLNFQSKYKSVTFSWDGRSAMSEKAVTGLSKPKAQTALNRAVSEVRVDIAEYTKRKIEEAARRVFRK
jgi:hypothetical protein